MATSGTLNTSAYEGRYLQFAWERTGTNIVANPATSTIHWTLTGAGSAVSSWYYAGPFTVVIDGQTVYSGGSRIQLYDGTTVASGDIIISHNADGTRSFAASVSGAIYSSSTNVSGSGSWDLDALPRATIPIAETTAIGNTMTIRLPRASANFTHRVLYYFGSLSGTLAEAAGDQLQWTIPMDFCAQLPNATSGTVQISCSTYNGSEYIGNAVIEVTLTVLPTVVPSAEETLSPVNDNSWVNSKGIYAAGFSRVKIDTAAAGVYGSTIKRIDISGDVTSYNAASSAVSDVLSSGTKSVTATVTDSRGRTKLDTKSITVQPYTKPIISSISYQRGTYTDGAWTDNDIGEDVKITFTLGLSLAAYGNRASISVDVDGETTQTTTNAAAGSHTYYFTTIGTDVTRPLVVSATDSTGTTGSQSADIPTINVAANYNSSLKSIRIGGVAEDAESFRVSWPAIFDTAMKILGSEMTDFVVGSGTDGIWNYIKLLNGLAVCWGGYTFTGLPIGNAWGSLYISTPVKYDYPTGLFIAAPEYFLSVSDCNGAYTSIGQTNNSGIDLKTGTRDFFVTRTDATTIGSIRICCLAIGRWKI